MWNLFYNHPWLDKKTIAILLLYNNYVSNLIDFVKENIDDEKLIEFIANEIIKKDISLFFEIDSKLDLISKYKNLFIKISLEKQVNLFKNHDWDIVSDLLELSWNTEDIVLNTRDLDILKYLTNNYLFSERSFSSIDKIYDSITPEKKEIIDEYFLKNMKKSFMKIFPLKMVLKSIKNNQDLLYKWENKQLQKIESILNKVKNNNIKNEIKDKDNFSFQFTQIDDSNTQTEIFIVTNNSDKKIFINLINFNNSITSKIFENNWIWNKKRNKFLDNLTKSISKKVSEIDEDYKIILNSFILKKWKSNKENNVFDIDWRWSEDCIFLMFKELSSDELQSFLDDFTNFKYYEDKEKEENDK